MKSIEEQLWDYIDGACPTDEHQAISLLIAQDDAWREKYLELLALNREIAAMELDAPSMAFTYNVMETIRAVHAQKPLKATIDKRVIKGIAGFFVVTILALLALMLMNMNWTAGSSTNAIHIKLPNLTKMLSGPALQGFLFFDVVLALFLLDTLLHKKFMKTT